ncbi:MAG: ABC transporter permease [Spirochaetales bacterium]|nr:ABC transporter permease [Spirochaetales bacterium]
MNIAGSLQLGFIYSLLALGVFISFRVMNIPDLTADGSFTLGLAVSAVLCIAGHPFAALVLGMLAGALAGTVTGLLQTKAGIHPILAGILTMTGLYSINLSVMSGSPNLSLIGMPTIFAFAQGAFPGVERNILRLAITFILAAVCVAGLIWFFKTGAGLRIRAAGNNEKMARASSINAEAVRVAAITLANAFIGLSGAVLAQYQGYADINSGAGIVIVGLASVILGEIFPRRAGAGRGLIFAAAGALIYRLLIALVLHFNFFPAYMLRFVSAVIVALALASPKIQAVWLSRKRNRRDAQRL